MNVQAPPDLVQGSLASGEGILCVGLPRTGSMSLASALQLLGIRHVHHIIWHRSDDSEWARFERAINDHYGTSSKKKMPWGKSQWDPWLGHFQAVTDAAGFFAPELIRTYPNAKVILVVRDYEPWARSMENTLLDALFTPFSILGRYGLDWAVGKPHLTRGFQALIGGWLGWPESITEAMRSCQSKYDEHHRLVRELVPQGQLLEYRMGDGWEPLAEFLGKKVPSVTFPHMNDAKSIKHMLEQDYIMKVRQGLCVLGRTLLPFLFLFVGYWLAGFSRR